MDVAVIACCGIGTYTIYKVLDFILRIPKIGSLETRCVLITGCDSGFGKAAVIKIDQEIKCHIFAACLTEAGETALKKMCSSRVTPLHMDVTDHQSVLKAYDYVKGELHKKGSAGLWGVVNNAGIGERGRADWLTVEDFKKVASVNLYGIIDVTATFLPLVKKSRGRIVNVSSVHGRYLCYQYPAYGITKHAVEAYSDALRMTMKPFGVSVHIVEPGGFKTAIADTWEEQLRNTWSRAPDDVKADYGQEYFEKYLEFLAKKSKKSGSGEVNGNIEALSPVTDAYMHALFGKYPRPRYFVANWSSYIIILIGLLPEFIGDFVYVRSREPPISLAIEGKCK